MKALRASAALLMLRSRPLWRLLAADKAPLVRIPAQAGRRFQPKLDSNSKASWTLIPAQPGQPIVIT